MCNHPSVVVVELEHPRCCNCDRPATNQLDGIWYCDAVSCEAQAVMEANEQGYGPLAASLRSVCLLCLMVLASFGCMSQTDVDVILLQSRVRVLEDRMDWFEEDSSQAVLDETDWLDANRFQD